MTFTYQFDTNAYKGSVSFETGLFINNKFVDAVKGGTIDIINPSTGKKITSVSGATKEDIDIAVDAAEAAFNTTWGLNTSGRQRGKLLYNLAQLLREHTDELAALESLNVGKPFPYSKGEQVGAIEILEYYAGWADKIQGKTLETDSKKFAYTRHEPIGVVGQIIPWNFPMSMLCWKLGPALATGNAVVLKPSEITPLTALFTCSLIAKAGFPPGVVNIVTGYGSTAGIAISEHLKIDKVAFTGSTAVGRQIMIKAAESNLKKVSLELGGKSPVIIFDDADVEQAVKWAGMSIFYNAGQICTAGSRILVQSGIYDKFVETFAAHARKVPVGDPFVGTNFQGPQVSQTQFDRVMTYIDHGKSEGATLLTGGERHGDEGYFIKPTIFAGVNPNMKIVKEEIFGPVGVVTKFETEEEAIKQANDTSYGLAASVFTTNLERGHRVAHAVKAGTTWINFHNVVDAAVPFGGFKQSGIGRELGEYALEHYTEVKSVLVNLGNKL